MTAGHRAARDVYLRRLRDRGLRDQRPRRWLLVLLVAAVGLCSGAAVAGATAGVLVYRHYSHAVHGLGDINQIVFSDGGGARIYDRNGTLLYAFQNPSSGLREPVPFAQLSSWAVKATVDTEDNTFWTNDGLNKQGIVRAALDNLGFGGYPLFGGPGGSSITQQLCKNVFIPIPERYQRSIDRKLKEAACALELTRRYPKPQILDWYLNSIYYANNTYGIDAAAQFYFGISAKSLDLAQAAMLVGIPERPLAYDPLLDFADAKLRQAQVLDLMVRAGDITPEQAAAAGAEKLVFRSSPMAVSTLQAPHFVFYVERQLREMFGCSLGPSAPCSALFDRGLRVYTSLDLGLQNQVQQIVHDKVKEFEARGYRVDNGAAVVLDNSTGEILAMVGSRNYFNASIDGEYNVATAHGMQPGSAFKPFVYLAAFLKGMYPASVVWDTPQAFPNGSGGSFVPSGPMPYWMGPMTARSALANSINAPADKTAAYAGVASILDVAHRVGIDSMYNSANYGPSIATGGSRLSLLDLTYGYSALANSGDLRGAPVKNPAPGHPVLKPVSVLRIVDDTGTTVYQLGQPSRFQAVSAPYAYLGANILEDVPAKKPVYGPYTRYFYLANGQPIAGKTGTQQGLHNENHVRETWTMGFLPQITVGVWTGNTDGSDVAPSVISFYTALPVWHDIMQKAADYLKLPAAPYPAPPGVVSEPAVVPEIGGKTCITQTEVFPADHLPASTDFCSAAGLGRPPQPTATPTPTPGGAETPTPATGATPYPTTTPMPPGATPMPTRQGARGATG